MELADKISNLLNLDNEAERRVLYLQITKSLFLGCTIENPELTDQFCQYLFASINRNESPDIELLNYTILNRLMKENPKVKEDFRASDILFIYSLIDKVLENPSVRVVKQILKLLHEFFCDKPRVIIKMFLPVLMHASMAYPDHNSELLKVIAPSLNIVWDFCHTNYEQRRCLLLILNHYIINGDTEAVLLLCKWFKAFIIYQNDVVNRYDFPEVGNDLINTGVCINSLKFLNINNTDVKISVYDVAEAMSSIKAGAESLFHSNLLPNILTPLFENKKDGYWVKCISIVKHLASFKIDNNVLFSLGVLPVLMEAANDENSSDTVKCNSSYALVELLKELESKEQKIQFSTEGGILRLQNIICKQVDRICRIDSTLVKMLSRSFVKLHNSINEIINEDQPEDITKLLHPGSDSEVRHAIINGSKEDRYLLVMQGYLLKIHRRIIREDLIRCGYYINDKDGLMEAFVILHKTLVDAVISTV